VVPVVQVLAAKGFILIKALIRVTSARLVIIVATALLLRLPCLHMEDCGPTQTTLLAGAFQELIALQACPKLQILWITLAHQAITAPLPQTKKSLALQDSIIRSAERAV